MLRPTMDRSLHFPRLSRTAAGLALALPLALGGFADAHPHPGHVGFGGDDDFSWAIISDQGQTNSGRFDSDLIDDLKQRYGTPFLVVEDESGRYVITDQKLVERGQKSAREIQKYGREIGEIAATQARLALSDSHHDLRKGQIEKKRKKLENEIRSGNPDRERMDEIEDELFRLKVELQALEGVERGSRLTPEERDELRQRQDVAKERLQRGVDRIEREMREILKTAKERHLAKRID